MDENKTFEIVKRKGTGFKILMFFYKNGLESHYGAEVRRKIKCSSAQIVNTIRRLQSIGILQFVEQKGKEKYWRLTERGEDISQRLENLDVLIQDGKDG